MAVSSRRLAWRPDPDLYLGVVHNPFARGGRAASADRRARFAAIVGGYGEVVETRSLPALQAEVARLAPVVTHWVADGGDGTLHWLINEVCCALRERDPAQWPIFVPTHDGTIHFVARKAGVRGRSDAILRAITRAAARNEPLPELSLDSLRIAGERADGSAFSRLGFALAAGGVGRRFFDLYDQERRGGVVAIARVIARALAALVLLKLGLGGSGRLRSAARLFEPTRARVVIDGEELSCCEHGAIHAGAFDVNLGGVFRVFPLAREPGVLHFQAGAISVLAMIANLPALARGGAVRAPGLCDTAGRCMRVDAEGDEPLSLVIDGERFAGLRWILVRPGPAIRIARVRA